MRRARAAPTARPARRVTTRRACVARVARVGWHATTVVATPRSRPTSALVLPQRHAARRGTASPAAPPGAGRNASSIPTRTRPSTSAAATQRPIAPQIKPATRPRTCAARPAKHRIRPVATAAAARTGPALQGRARLLAAAQGALAASALARHLCAARSTAAQGFARAKAAAAARAKSVASRRVSAPEGVEKPHVAASGLRPNRPMGGVRRTGMRASSSGFGGGGRRSGLGCPPANEVFASCMSAEVPSLWRSGEAGSRPT